MVRNLEASGRELHCVDATRPNRRPEPQAIAMEKGPHLGRSAAAHRRAAVLHPGSRHSEESEGAADAAVRPAGASSPRKRFELAAPRCWAAPVKKAGGRWKRAWRSSKPSARRPPLRESLAPLRERARLRATAMILAGQREGRAFSNSRRISSWSIRANPLAGGNRCRRPGLETRFRRPTSTRVRPIERACSTSAAARSARHRFALDDERVCASRISFRCRNTSSIGRTASEALEGR